MTYFILFIKNSKLQFLCVVLLYLLMILFQLLAIFFILEGVELFVNNLHTKNLSFISEYIDKENVLVYIFIFLSSSTILYFYSRYKIVNYLISFEQFLINILINFVDYDTLSILLRKNKLSKKQILNQYTKDTKYYSRSFDSFISFILHSITVIILVVISLYYANPIIYILIGFVIIVAYTLHNKYGKLHPGVFEKQIRNDFIYRGKLINEIFDVKSTENVRTKWLSYINSDNSTFNKSLVLYKKRLLLNNMIFLYIGISTSIIIPIIIYYHEELLFVEHDKLIFVYFIVSLILIKTISAISKIVQSQYLLSLVTYKYKIWKD